MKKIIKLNNKKDADIKTIFTLILYKQNGIKHGNIADIEVRFFI